MIHESYLTNNMLAIRLISETEHDEKVVGVIRDLVEKGGSLGVKLPGEKVISFEFNTKGAE